MISLLFVRPLLPLREVDDAIDSLNANDATRALLGDAVLEYYIHAASIHEGPILDLREQLAALTPALVDIEALLDRSRCGSDSMSAESAAEWEAEYATLLRRATVLFRAHVRTVRETHCALARNQAEGANSGSAGEGRWESCRQAGLRQHRSESALADHHRRMIDAAGRWQSGDCARDLQADFLSIAFPTIHPDPTSLSSLVAEVTAIVPVAALDGVALSLLAGAESRRRDICGQMEAESRWWDSVKTSEFGGNDHWTRHCRQFEALWMQRRSVAQSALDELRVALAAPTVPPSVKALIDARCVELHTPEVVQPDPQVKFTITLTDSPSRSCQ